ncbi:MAG: HAMP domain-containing sensor histidine kinase [Oceanicaulis sp.]
MDQPSPGARGQRPPGLLAKARAGLVSMPGKLLGLTVISVLIAEVLIFFPSAADFRTEWLMDRAEAAHLAALAAESAGDMELGEEMVRELLAGADAAAVARITDGVNELVLGGDIGKAKLVTADLTEEGFFDSIAATVGTLTAPEGRYVNALAAPRTRPDGGELISVIVPEAGLKRDLWAYSRNIALLSLFIAAFAAGLLYVALLILLVRPMRRLARAMTAFAEDPSAPGRASPAARRRDEIGEAEAALAAMQDEVRAAFAQRERLAALGGAVARINHDLRNVLASAQLVSDRLATSTDERIAAMGARLVRAVDRGIRLCRDTLEYGRSAERAPDLAPVSLRNAVDDAAGDAFAATGAADWSNAISEDARALADPDHLHRIVLNLVRNSVQAMDGRADAAIMADCREAGGVLILSLTDTGPGVPDRVAETLFQPFGRSGASGGSGLGLSIARELARAMGGEVSLARTGPDGSVFEVRLQAAAPYSAASAAAVSSSAAGS